MSVLGRVRLDSDIDVVTEEGSGLIGIRVLKGPLANPPTLERDQSSPPPATTDSRKRERSQGAGAPRASTQVEAAATARLWRDDDDVDATGSASAVDSRPTATATATGHIAIGARLSIWCFQCGCTVCGRRSSSNAAVVHAILRALRHRHDTRLRRMRMTTTTTGGGPRSSTEEEPSSSPRTRREEVTTTTTTHSVAEVYDDDQSRRDGRSPTPPSNDSPLRRCATCKSVTHWDCIDVVLPFATFDDAVYGDRCELQRQGFAPPGGVPMPPSASTTVPSMSAEVVAGRPLEEGAPQQGIGSAPAAAITTAALQPSVVVDGASPPFYCSQRCLWTLKVIPNPYFDVDIAAQVERRYAANVDVTTRTTCDEEEETGPRHGDRRAGDVVDDDDVDLSTRWHAREYRRRYWMLKEYFQLQRPPIGLCPFHSSWDSETEAQLGAIFCPDGQARLLAHIAYHGRHVGSDPAFGDNRSDGGVWGLGRAGSVIVVPDPELLAREFSNSRTARGRTAAAKDLRDLREEWFAAPVLGGVSSVAATGGNKANAPARSKPPTVYNPAILAKISPSRFVDGPITAGPTVPVSGAPVCS